LKLAETDVDNDVIADWADVWMQQQVDSLSDAEDGKFTSLSFIEIIISKYYVLHLTHCE